MNRFGIRLAAGMAVICLGTLAVFQAQNAKKTDELPAWPDAQDVAAQEPPAPLGISSTDWPAPPDTQPTVVRANNELADGDWQTNANPGGGVPGAVRLANHQQLTDDMGASDQPAFAPPPLDQPSYGQPSLDQPSLDQPSFAQPSFEQPSYDEPRLDQPSFGAPSMPDLGSPAPATNTALTTPAASEYAADDYANDEGLQLPSLDTPQAPAPVAAPQFEPNSELTLRPVGSGVAADQPADPPALTGNDPVEEVAANWGNDLPSSEPPIQQLTPVTPSLGTPQPTSTALIGSGVNNGYSTNEPAGVLPTQIVELDETLGQPGQRELEGQQTPSIVIQKRAPAEVRVGKPTEFVLSVRNVGTIPALDVRVFDRVPEGTELVETVPPSTQFAGMLTWQLGDLEPGQERTLIMRVVPQTEGELGSVARVTFEAAASVRTIATQPALKLVQKAPPQVLIGQQLLIDLELSNGGSGAAQNVVLKTDLPEGLEHEHGSQIELPIGQMPPGDARRQILRVRATKPGLISNTIWLVDADGTQTPSTIEVEVVSPAVEVALEGPSLRYLERQATYQVQIGNSGTADATNVEIAAFLDKGLKFVSTESAGQYDPNRHAVFWSLEELPAGQAGSVPLTLLPVEAGQQDVRLEARADLGVTAASEKELTIETLAELTFSIADDQDPIEVGADTTYTIRVQNLGSRDDTNVRLEVQLPHPAMQVQGCQPDAQQDNSGRIVFEPIARIPAKGEQLYILKVRGAIADTHLIKATVVSDQSRKPVTKEESTTVYSDR